MTKKETINKLKNIKPIMFPTCQTYDMGLQFIFANKDGYCETFGYFADWPLVQLKSVSKKFNYFTSNLSKKEKEKLIKKAESRPNKTFYFVLVDEEVELYYSLKEAWTRLTKIYYKKLKDELISWDSLDDAEIEVCYEDMMSNKNHYYI